MCVFRERERERERVVWLIHCVDAFGANGALQVICVCVCSERERERERESCVTDPLCRRLWC